MAVSLFTFVDLYDRALDTVSHLLTKGRSFATERDIDEAEMLSWRLIEDMHPLAFQVMVVINFARQWPARVADLAVPESIGADLTIDGFLTAASDAKSFLARLTAAQFAGRDDVPLTFKIAEGFEPTLPSGQWLSVFATTNLYFHLTTAYGILRAKGVPVGKADIFANRL